MVEKTSHVPGTFCWSELATSDQAAAKVFYSSLFGWTAHDVPSGSDNHYTMLRLRGKDIGALYTMPSDVAEQGVPPHWMTYVAVADVDASAALAKKLGGSLLNNPADLMDAGRMCVVRDPQGATLALWQARRHVGAAIYGEPGAACWSELQTTDTDAAKAFYSGLFGWQAMNSTDGMDYTEWLLPEVKQFGGMIQIHADWGPVPPHWMIYFQVEDCDAAAAKAVALGAKTYVPPKDIPHTGRFSVLADPQGAVFALFRLAEGAS